SARRPRVGSHRDWNGVVPLANGEGWRKRHSPEPPQRGHEVLPPGLPTVLHAIALADGRHLRWDLSWGVGGKLGEEVMLDLMIQCAAQDTHPGRNGVVVGRFDLHPVPATAAPGAGGRM